MKIAVLIVLQLFLILLGLAMYSKALWEYEMFGKTSLFYLFGAQCLVTESIFVVFALYLYDKIDL